MSFENIDTSVSNTPADASTSATPSPATPENPNAGLPATPNQAPQMGAPSTPNEGRVPSYRIRETREQVARQMQAQWQQREAEYQSRFDAMQKQLQALVGVTPQGDPEVEQIRQRFSQLYPGLSALEQRAQQLQELVSRSSDLEAQNQHYWTSYGRQTMDRLYSKAGEALGGQLNDSGKRALHAAFVGYIQSDPELTQRYTQDPSVVDEFVQMWQSSFIDPVRRTAAAGVQQATNPAQRILPQDAPSGMPQASPAPRLGNLDDRAAAAWASWTNRGQR
jgi:hypothetical protein